jgi:hypothetical protein
MMHRLVSTVILSLVLLSGPLASAQAQTVLRGTVTDASTGEPLPSATVQVDGTYTGTITNDDGRYALRVDSLPVRLVVRFIGYQTERRTVTDASARPSFSLSPSSVEMGEVVVTGEDFAENVMRKVVERKQQWWDSLRTYEVEAYNRFTISNDSGIVSIAESRTAAFWRRGDGTREIVKERRQTANLDVDALPAAATVENLYADNVDLFDHSLVGVTHPEAVDRYHFTLDSVRARNGTRVYDIRVEPERRTLVGFRGQISVLDSAYAVIDARLEPTRAVRFPRGVNLRDVSFRQQFSRFGGPFWLPVDYRARYVVDVGLGALLQVPTIRVDQVSRLSNYAVNAPVPDSLFETDEAVRVDSAAVAEQTRLRADRLNADSVRVDTVGLAGTKVPLSDAEQQAYETIDSTQTMEEAFEPTGPLARMAEATDDGGSDREWTPDWMRVTPQGRYNRVEGGHLGGRLTLDLGSRLEVSGRSAYNTAAPGRYDWSYGGNARIALGADEQWEVGGEYGLGIRTWYDADAFTGRVGPLAEFENSAVALTADGDNFDYYGSERVEGFVRRTVDPIDLSLRVSVVSEDLDPVSKQTDYDVFGDTTRLRPNPRVRDQTIRSIEGRIVWGEAPELFSPGAHQRVALAVEHSSPGFLQSDADFTRLSAAAEVRVPTFFQRRLRPNQLRLHVEGGTALGTLPLARAHTVGGLAMTTLGELETLDERSYQGEHALGLFWEHHFRTLPFELLGLMDLADRRWGISVHGGHVRSWFGDARLAELQQRNPFLTDAQGWHHEVGASLTGLFGILEIDGTVRLDEPGFTLGLGTAVLF